MLHAFLARLHLQLWLDFIADTGDGGNSTYAVAAALAAPSLTVEVRDAPSPVPRAPAQTLVWWLVAHCVDARARLRFSGGALGAPPLHHPALGQG